MRKLLDRLWLASLAFAALGAAIAYGNYTATQGSGTTFGSIVVSTVHYAQVMLCDLTTPSQCAAVSAGGAVSTGAASGAYVDGSQATIGAQADAACATDTGTCTVVAIHKRLNQLADSSIPAGSAIIGKVGIDQTLDGTTNAVRPTSQYPAAAVPLTASATGTTGATTATLAATALVKTYICGFSIRANATAAATANSTVTGTVTGTLNYTQWTAPNASGIGLTEQVFMPCVPSSAINTGVAVISAAPGTGGVVSVTAWGYQAP